MWTGEANRLPRALDTCRGRPEKDIYAEGLGILAIAPSIACGSTSPAALVAVRSAYAGLSKSRRYGDWYSNQKASARELLRGQFRSASVLANLISRGRINPRPSPRCRTSQVQCSRIRSCCRMLPTNCQTGSFLRLLFVSFQPVLMTISVRTESDLTASRYIPQGQAAPAADCSTPIGWSRESRYLLRSI